MTSNGMCASLQCTSVAASPPVQFSIAAQTCQAQMTSNGKCASRPNLMTQRSKIGRLLAHSGKMHHSAGEVKDWSHTLTAVSVESQVMAPSLWCLSTFFALLDQGHTQLHKPFQKRLTYPLVFA